MICQDDEHINLEVLQTEIEEAKQILVVPVPGSVLRVGLRETFGAPNPGWMQYDDEDRAVVVSCATGMVPSCANISNMMAGRSTFCVNTFQVKLAR